ARLYKTGDRCRWLADGNIEFLGRKDAQVKIRGNRVELGEVESVMGGHPGVSQCVVVDKDDLSGGKRLIGYLVAEGSFDKESILEHMRRKMPEYMVPAALIQLDRLPLTNNGKVNRRALPDPDLSVLFKDQYTAPRTETEQALAGIWQQLLGIERVGIYDNFFELGGHSLLVTQVVALLSKKFFISVPVRALFEFRNIHNLGQYIELELSRHAVKQESTAAFDVIEL
ncbi:MAG TPA: phosphopantetheine-binding protein, partial [Chitinophagaceae bacterium]|nr:phosphopantetheine-binding protein [Chitinophagaceae bacterium]